MTKALIIIAITELIGVTVTIFNTVMWLYFNKKEDKRRDAQDRVVELLQKEKPEQLFSNECVRCIHADSLCVPSDYGKDKDNYCDHFKSVFEENEELKDKLKNLESVAEVRLANWQKYEKENAELKKQIEKMKRCQNCKFEDNDYIEEPCSVCTRCLGDIKRKGNSDKWELQEN